MCLLESRRQEKALPSPGRKGRFDRKERNLAHRSGGHGRRGSGLFLVLVAAVAAILLAGAALGVVHRGGRDLAGGGGLGALVAGAALLTIGSVGRNGGLGHGLLGASGAIALFGWTYPRRLQRGRERRYRGAKTSSCFYSSLFCQDLVGGPTKTWSHGTAALKKAFFGPRVPTFSLFSNHAATDKLRALVATHRFDRNHRLRLKVQKL